MDGHKFWKMNSIRGVNTVSTNLEQKPVLGTSNGMWNPLSLLWLLQPIFKLRSLKRVPKFSVVSLSCLSSPLSANLCGLKTGITSPVLGFSQVGMLMHTSCIHMYGQVRRLVWLNFSEGKEENQWRATGVYTDICFFFFWVKLGSLFHTVVSSSGQSYLAAMQLILPFIFSLILWE